MGAGPRRPYRCFYFAITWVYPLLWIRSEPETDQKQVLYIFFNQSSQHESHALRTAGHIMWQIIARYIFYSVNAFGKQMQQSGLPSWRRSFEVIGQSGGPSAAAHLLEISLFCGQFETPTCCKDEREGAGGSRGQRESSRRRRPLHSTPAGSRRSIIKDIQWSPAKRPLSCLSG